MTNISNSFYLQEGGKNQLAQILNKKLRHYYPIYITVLLYNFFRNSAPESCKCDQ